jgi:hypothetical protein
MKIFKDASLKEEVKDLDMGIVLAGDTKQVTYYLYNDTDAEVVELKPVIDNAEVKVVSCPSTLKSKESAPAVFEWTASITVKRGLRTQLNLKFFELYS